MGNMWENFKFGLALGMGLAVAYVAVKVLAWVFTTAAHGMPTVVP